MQSHLPTMPTLEEAVSVPQPFSCVERAHDVHSRHKEQWKTVLCLFCYSSCAVITSTTVDLPSTTQCFHTHALLPRWWAEVRLPAQCTFHYIFVILFTAACAGLKPVCNIPILGRWCLFSNQLPADNKRRQVFTTCTANYKRCALKINPKNFQKWKMLLSNAWYKFLRQRLLLLASNSTLYFWPISLPQLIVHGMQVSGICKSSYHCCQKCRKIQQSAHKVNALCLNLKFA